MGRAVPNVYDQDPGGGQSSSVFETHMGFDTGSTALCVFPTELHLLLHDFTYIQFTNSSLPVGSVRAGAFQIRVRVLSEEGEQLVDWIYDTAACLGEGQVRLSSFALQENAFVTIDPANHILFATTSRARLGLFAAIGQ